MRLQLSPQSLKSVLRSGIALQVHSNKVANGILTVSISRAEAKRAHIKVGRGATVVIARGTTAGIKNGVSFLRLHLPRKVAAKLKKLRHATFSVRLSLVASRRRAPGHRRRRQVLRAGTLRLGAGGRLGPGPRRVRRRSPQPGSSPLT